jgi:DHA1 family bicyclomycin/chloramphenicol resistance-like MFS transporter
MSAPASRPRDDERRLWGFALLLATLTTIGPFAVDTYLPSFPAIGQSLGASAFEVQQTLSVYLACFSVTMLVHGTLADRYGRRPVIVAGLAVFAVASVVCALAQSIGALIAARGLQGLSAGAGMVVARAIVRDRFPGPEAQRLMARMTMIFGIAPAVAPVLGGWLHHWFGWRSVFVFLAALAVVLLAATLRFLPETLAHERRQPINPRYVLRTAAAMLAHRQFMLLSGAVALEFAGLWLYIAAAPAFLMDHLGLDERQFGWLFVTMVVGMIIGSYVSSRAQTPAAMRRAVTAGYAVQALAAAVNVAYCAAFEPRLPFAIAPVFVYCIGMYLAKPTLLIAILDLFPDNRGMASSVQAFLQTLAGSLVAGFVAPALAVSPLALALGMALALGAGLLCWAAYLGELRAVQHI